MHEAAETARNGSRTKALRVLVVDDEPIALALCSGILRNVGHVVFPATDGSAAVELATRRRFDVAVIDLVMPRLRGEMVVKHLRRTLPQIGIVAMTAWATRQAVARCVDAGADRFLRKPFDSIKELVEAVEGSVAPRRPTASLLRQMRGREVG